MTGITTAYSLRKYEQAYLQKNKQRAHEAA